MAKPVKKSSNKVTEKTSSRKTISKTVKKASKVEPELDRNRAMAEFLAKKSVPIENDLQLVSNSIIEPRDLS